jgi:Globin
MFETRADVMAMFEQFRSVDKADLGSSRALENHALLVMNALDEAIANMDDPEYLVEMLLTTGKSHRRFDNFSTIIFWVQKSNCSSTHSNTHRTLLFR